MKLGRRGFLKALGIGVTALAAEEILEPVKKLWFVPSNAPVGSRIERIAPPRIVAPPPIELVSLLSADDVEEGIWPLKAGRRTSLPADFRGLRVVPHKYVNGREAYALAGGLLYVSVPTYEKYFGALS